MKTNHSFGGTGLLYFKVQDDAKFNLKKNKCKFSINHNILVQILALPHAGCETADK